MAPSTAPAFILTVVQTIVRLHVVHRYQTPQTYSYLNMLFSLVFQTFIVHMYFLVNYIKINNLKTDSTVHKLFNSHIFNVIE